MKVNMRGFIARQERITSNLYELDKELVDEARRKHNLCADCDCDDGADGGVPGGANGATRAGGTPRRNGTGKIVMVLP